MDLMKFDTDIVSYPTGKLYQIDYAILLVYFQQVYNPYKNVYLSMALQPLWTLAAFSVS
jgi:hypothetical protein